MKGTITVANNAATCQPANNANKKVIFKNCAPFTNYISRKNNMQVDDADEIDVLMPMYNLIKYGDNYSKASGILWRYSRDEPAVVAANGDDADFNAANATAHLFKLKEKIIGQTGNDGTKYFEILVPIKYLRNF